MPKIIPSLWFDVNAEEAVKFYVSVFKNSRILRVARYTEAGPGAKGSVMTIAFTLGGQEFLAINGGPEFKFTPAVSFTVNCRNQAEIDYYWRKLAKGGKGVQCGWLEDKFGLSWQIVPDALGKMVSGRDAKKADRVMRAVLGMVKLDVKTLAEAYAG